MATPTRKPIEQKTESVEKVGDRYPFRHSLDTGDRGVLVMWAQSKLMKHGKYEGELDGRYDREVSLAVRAFQGDNKLMVTGVIDRKTWDALQLSE
jgi:peptidoglycan hydrolase-like protein with peptidoglycan-binding domain